MEQKKRIVVIGGGTGVFNTLSGLKNRGHTLSAVVTMADDGGSTGVLREEFGILPPGDVRRALIALADAEAELLAGLFEYRFAEGGFEGHSMGNLLLTALERMTGSFEGAVLAAEKLLGVEGSVIPVTLDDIRLKAVLSDGTEILGESRIDVPQSNRTARIARVEIVGDAKPNPRAIEAIAGADMIVIGPGDLYTSILPNLAVPGIADAVRDAAGQQVFVVNVMTKFGETDGYTARDFADVLEQALGTGALQTLVVNTAPPPAHLKKRYLSDSKPTEPVRYDEEAFINVPYSVCTADVLRTDGELIRHDSHKLADVLESLLSV